MPTIRAISTEGGRKTQAIVRKRNQQGLHHLSHTFWLAREAQDWARRVEDAIASATPARPFDRSKWLMDDLKPSVADTSSPQASWSVRRALSHYADTLVDQKKGAKVEKVRIRFWIGRDITTSTLLTMSLREVQRVVDQRLAGGLAADTVRREVNVLRALYRDAALVWKIEGLPNPFAGLKLPRAAPHRERRLEDGHGDLPSEEARLRSALATWRRNPAVHLDMFDFAIETGLRLSEVHALKVASIRRTDGVTRVELGDSKNSDPRRVVLSKRASEIAERRSAGCAPRAKLFPVSDSARRRAWASARKEAGVVDLRWHDLRHEAISRMAGKNLHLGELMAQSGHRDAESLKRYMNARAKDIADKLG